jgi:hypothetical protein
MVTDPLPEQYLRFRLWVAGELVHEAVVDVGDHIPLAESMALIDRMSAAQAKLCTFADEAGKLWMIEAYDSETKEHKRFGTDERGMVKPVELPRGEFPWD